MLVLMGPDVLVRFVLKRIVNKQPYMCRLKVKINMSCMRVLFKQMLFMNIIFAFFPFFGL